VSKGEQLLTDVYGDPSYLVFPLCGNYSFRYSNEPDCSTCGCASCDAQASTVSIGHRAFRLLPGEGAVYEDEQYRIEFRFHAGRAYANPTCTDERPCPGPQLYSDFTIHLQRISETRFSRGDSNSDNDLDLADAIFTLSYLFAKGPAPSCLDSADANDDGAVDLADGVYILQNLFANGPAIPAPYPDCGVDTTVDELGCLEYSGCE
jgi:hypothetical protein